MGTGLRKLSPVAHFLQIDWFFDFDKWLILMDWRWPSKSSLSHSSNSHFSSALSLNSRSPNSHSPTSLSPNSLRRYSALTHHVSGNCQATMYNIRCKLYGVIQHLTDSIVIPLQWVWCFQSVQPRQVYIFLVSNISQTLCPLLRKLVSQF